jgi:hypothetical protein
MGEKYTVLFLDAMGTTVWEYDNLKDAQQAVDNQKGNNSCYGVHNAAVVPKDIFNSPENCGREYKWFYRHYGASVQLTLNQLRGGYEN